MTGAGSATVVPVIVAPGVDGTGSRTPPPPGQFGVSSTGSKSLALNPAHAGGELASLTLEAPLPPLVIEPRTSGPGCYVKVRPSYYESVLYCRNQRERCLAVFAILWRRGNSSRVFFSAPPRDCVLSDAHSQRLIQKVCAARCATEPLVVAAARELASTYSPTPGR